MLAAQSVYRPAATPMSVEMGIGRQTGRGRGRCGCLLARLGRNLQLGAGASKRNWLVYVGTSRLHVGTSQAYLLYYFYSGR